MQKDEARPRRRRRARAETEQDLLDAALRVVARNGILEGVPLRDVAAEAGVNHGQIYQYFGSRQALLRAAISRTVRETMPDPSLHWERTFTERRQAMWRWAVNHPDLPKLEALLALERDADLVMFPEIERTRVALERDKATGELPADADSEAFHMITAATYLGYSIFRERFAADLGVEVEELDRRAAAAFERLLAGLTGSGDAGSDAG